MKKKIISILLVAVIAISFALVPGVNSKAASYPTFVPQEENRTLYQDAEDATTAVVVVYDITSAYKYERIYVDLYDPNGNPVANNGENGRMLFNDTMDKRSYTLSWDITGKPVGKYTIKAHMKYSSDGSNWYDAPDEIVTYVNIEKTKPTLSYSNEWVDGKWYDSEGKQTYSGRLTWYSNEYGWWVEDSAGWYPVNSWQKIDGKWYYFTSSGYMDYSEYRDGFWLGSDGAWVESYSGGHWCSDSNGWWYEDASGWYPVNQYVWIDGVNYWFGADGYWK